MAVDEHWDVLLESVRECAKPAKHRSISIHVGMIFVWYLTCFIVLPPIYGRSLRMVVYGCLDVYGIWVYRFTTLVGYHVFFLRFMSIMRSTEKMTTTVWFIEHNWLMYTCNGYETVLFLSLCLSLSLGKSGFGPTDIDLPCHLGLPGVSHGLQDPSRSNPLHLV